jgi:hypothetical protein
MIKIMMTGEDAFHLPRVQSTGFALFHPLSAHPYPNLSKAEIALFTPVCV